MSLHQLVTEAAGRYPGRLALSAPDGRLTYRELDLAANALAHRLRAGGVGRGDRVVIWADKGAQAVVAMQATLRLGAVYVPVDGTVPGARAMLIARDCEARAVCVNGDRRTGLPGEIVIGLPEDPSANTAPIAIETADTDLAYILYTSGSTGAPKGVCITHGNSRAFVDWAVAELNAGPEDRFSNHAPYSFDLSVLDLYAAFSAGASVHVIPAELAYAPDRLVEFARAEEISIWYSVPSVLTLMMRDGGLLDAPSPASLRVIIFAGEPFSIGQVRNLHAWTDARLINMYGPTETNVCTYHEVGESDLGRDRPVPIGQACSGDSAWAETADGKIAARGEEGELIVSGPTVMAGYWGKAPHAGPYRTGDIVKVIDEGIYDYVGRNDHMVKVRGHRVEIAEVEASLETHPEVEDSAVVVVGSGVDARLDAFVVASTGTEPGLLTLKRHLSQRLPRYMIVDRVHAIAELPRTDNGKIDRIGLTERAASLATV